MQQSSFPVVIRSIRELRLILLVGELLDAGTFTKATEKVPDFGGTVSVSSDTVAQTLGIFRH
jgi:hypothetical protein